MSSGFGASCDTVCPAPPAQESGALVDPVVAAGHLSNALYSEAQQTKNEADRGVDEEIVKRQELAAKQEVVDEANACAEQQHEQNDLPPRPPGLGDGIAGDRRRPAAQNDIDHEERD